MKKLFIIMLINILPLFAQYGFNFSCINDTIQSGNNNEVKFYFRLENTGAVPDSYLFDCRVVDSVPGWGEIYCVGGRCAEPGIPLYDYLDSGAVDTTIDVAVYPKPSSATEIINLFCQSIGDPTLKDSINIYVVGVQAVQEKEKDNENIILNLYPVPFKNRLIIGSTQPGQIEIFDVTGKRIKAFEIKKEALWDGTDIFGKTLPSGVYVIGLKYNNKCIQRKVIKLKR